VDLEIYTVRHIFSPTRPTSCYSIFTITYT